MFFGTHTPGGVVVLIDLGGAADFETGQGCSGDEAMFDPVYGAPEQFTRTKKAGIVGGFGGLFGGGKGDAAGLAATAGAYHLLTIVHVFKPHLSSSNHFTIALTRPR
jgi:hypothetical protein